LNDLEAKPTPACVKDLSSGEKNLAIAHFREILPTSLLGHHDSRIARGKRSLAAVKNGVCGGCHLALPSGHRTRKASGDLLDVCDNCGIFLEWPAARSPEADLSEKSNTKRGLESVQ